MAASGLYGTCFGVLNSQGSPIVLQSLPLNLFPIGTAIELTSYGISTAVGGYIGGECANFFYDVKAWGSQ
jgi:hypothetical protein